MINPLILEKILNKKKCVQISIGKKIIADMHYDECYYHEGTTSFNFESEGDEYGNSLIIVGEIQLRHIKSYEVYDSFINIVY